MNLTAERRAGVCMHITSLPGPHGIGAIGAHARWFVQRIAQMGLSVWQVLPIGPTGYGNSPYQSLSVFAGNTLLIDLASLAKDGLLTDAEMARLPAGTSGAQVAFGEVIGVRSALIERAASRFDTVAATARRIAFEEFLHRHDERWLADYALYRVAKTRHGERPWHEWETPLARREPAALARLAQTAADAVRAEKISQFFFFEQWAALRDYAREHGVLLIGDVPIYVALDSADTWSRPELFELDAAGRPTAVGGVPPDYFSADGQLWGNPLYRWDYHAQTGFEWWTERMRHACALTDFVRIDHFRGFEAFWSVPAGASTARNGEWRPGPREAIFDALRNELGDLPIIAEDLGIITDAVEALRKRYGLPGMAVLQFLLADEQFRPEQIQSDRLCYTGTHDNDTTVSWFAGGDQRPDEQVQRMRARILALTGEPAARVHVGMLRMAMNSPACLGIAPMQDFLGLPTFARFNVPGVPTGNWRWRLQTHELGPQIVDQYRAMVHDSGRVPASWLY